MLKRVSENFRNGMERIKWFSSVVSARLKIEIAVIKLLHRSDQVRRQRDELIGAIGERVYEMRANPDRNVLRDGTIRESIARIEELEKEIEDLNHRAKDVSGVGI